MQITCQFHKMFCKQILGENRMRKAENPERDFFRICSADPERGCPHILPQEWSTSERCLFLLCLRNRTWHRLQRSEKGAWLSKFGSSQTQSYKNGRTILKRECVCLDWGTLVGGGGGSWLREMDLAKHWAVHSQNKPLPNVRQPLCVWSMLNWRYLFY